MIKRIALAAALIGLAAPAYAVCPYNADPGTFGACLTQEQNQERALEEQQRQTQIMQQQLDQQRQQYNDQQWANHWRYNP